MKMKLFSVSIFIVALSSLYLIGPIPQAHSYHNFADQRCMCGIPNAFDVLSNLSFLIIGIFGMIVSLKSYGCNKCPLHLIYLIFFMGIAAVSIGSSYYHWAPCNETLVWDRLPMTIAFMALFAAIIVEQLNKKVGYILLLPLLIFGFLSVLYWQQTDDLRLYILVQFLPMILIPLMLFANKARSGLRINMILLILGYTVSKICEQLDYQIFELTGKTVSGHTLKHLTAAVSIVFVIRLIKIRKS